MRHLRLSDEHSPDEDPADLAMDHNYREFIPMSIEEKRPLPAISHQWRDAIERARARAVRMRPAPMTPARAAQLTRSFGC